MITNTGKNIIAKYLVGDTPAYASYIVLGCGQRPRANVTTLSSVETATISGTISGTSATTTITGISSTLGLVVGMSLEKVSGTGAFGGTSQVATITTINSNTSITITSTASNTAGSIVFRTFGSASILLVENSDFVWKGAKLSIISADNGELSSISDTLVTRVISDTRITVSPGTEEFLDNATLLIEVDPNKKALDFEMFRVPITSKGYINDDGVNKIVFTSQLPSEERYEITEVGIYSAGSNSFAGSYDSKTITAFSGSENWELSFGNSLAGPALDSVVFREYETSIINSLNNIVATAPAIKTSSSNGVFSNVTRSARYERPRYLSNVFLLKGDTSFISKSGSILTPEGTPTYLQTVGRTIDFSRNAPADILKLAFSILSIEGASLDVPESVRIVVEFSNPSGSQYAKMNIDATDLDYRFTDNRYVLAEKRLDELEYSAQFSWRTIDTIKVYSSVVKNIAATHKLINSGVATLDTFVSHNLKVGDAVKVSGAGGLDGIRVVTNIVSDSSFSFATTEGNAIYQEIIPPANIESGSSDFYIALDGLRIDNISTINPVYGLVGYSIIQNDDREPIVKSPNSTNFIEYRFVMDVT
jgi:hypothetical protein